MWSVSGIKRSEKLGNNSKNINCNISLCLLCWATILLICLSIRRYIVLTLFAPLHYNITPQKNNHHLCPTLITIKYITTSVPHRMGTFNCEIRKIWNSYRFDISSSAVSFTSVCLFVSCLVCLNHQPVPYPRYLHIIIILYTSCHHSVISIHSHMTSLGGWGGRESQRGIWDYWASLLCLPCWNLLRLGPAHPPHHPHVPRFI